jgi:alpha-tubulin suppressor-like RCC1 family protein
LWSWGRNVQGALGDGTTSLRSTPVQVFGGGTKWQRVYTNLAWVNLQAFTMALKTDGSLWAWGQNGTAATGGNFGISASQISSALLSPVWVGGNASALSLGVPNPDYLWKVLPTTGNVLSAGSAAAQVTMLAILDVQGY